MSKQTAIIIALTHMYTVYHEAKFIVSTILASALSFFSYHSLSRVLRFILIYLCMIQKLYIAQLNNKAQYHLPPAVIKEHAGFKLLL